MYSQVNSKSYIMIDTETNTVPDDLSPLFKNGKNFQLKPATDSTKELARALEQLRKERKLIRDAEAANIREIKENSPWPWQI
jgi:hypothetical protein